MPEPFLMRTKGKGAPKPEKTSPDPAKLIKGKYVQTTWNHWLGEDSRLYCGIWESTPGKVKCAYDEWEFCHIISGEVILTEEGKKKGHRFKKGDGFIIPAGFKGTWETVKKVRKHYVILLPKG
ncbi:MAG: cupin domain-containing protein [Proteobacteria bacterium]|nr:cupin domain-containing protein [Pseudomonadota bacterium]